MSYNYLPLDSKPLGFNQVKNLIHYKQDISITFDAHERITRCRAYLDTLLQQNERLYYGINTGFGFLQDVKISNEQIEQLQANLLMSHACGMGEEVPLQIVKLMLAFKIKSLSHGYSGVQIDTVKRLTEMHNHNILPVIYTQGSLGASGDLAPLSHMSLPLIGLGEVYYEGQKQPTKAVWETLSWDAVHLRSKEGLALINGTQFMSAYGLYILVQCERLIEWANMITAISFDAFDCSLEPFHEKIQEIRPHAGQVTAANAIRGYLHGSNITNTAKKQVQDPYSFRCVPQVHGASIDTFNYVKDVFLREINLGNRQS